MFEPVQGYDIAFQVLDLTPHLCPKLYQLDSVGINQHPATDIWDDNQAEGCAAIRVNADERGRNVMHLLEDQQYQPFISCQTELFIDVII